MSETIDKRIVQMRFDNAQFESGVTKTMSTLDKLKKALHMENAITGMEKVQSAFSKFDVSGVTGGIETVNAKFSAMQTVAFTVMQNIVNDAYAKGKQLAKAFTIEPVFSGFEEYETQINAVQTILANTQDKGTTLDDVNNALDELNHYADLTIYNFTEMTRNIGTFTAAGIDLDNSVDAIKGIANLAAVSGSTSAQASTAMYQLSQALAAGTVNLQDWNSVVNAGMGGQVFQNALKRTARQMGQDVDGMIEKYGSFRLSLSEGAWLTADVLTETLKQFAGAYSEAELIQKGYSQTQAAEIVKMAETATNAATKVKTFTQLFDTLKEAAQSGWTQTWEIIVGDFEEAKDFLTGLSDYFSDIINNISNNRNNFLEEVFSESGQYVHKEDWENLTNNGIVGYAFRTALIDVAREHGVAIDKMIAEEGSFSDSLKNGWLTLDIFNEVLEDTKNNALASEAALNNTGTTVENLKNVVAEVIRGNWGAGDTWKQALIDAGYNMEVIRDLVNQTYDGIDYDLGRISEETWTASAAMAGYGDAIANISTEAYFANTPLMDLVEKLERPTGRELLIESVWNIIKGIASILKPIKEAWDETFAGPSAEAVYQLVAGFEKLTSKLNISFSTSLKIKSAFKGLFAVLDIGVMAFKAVVNAIMPFTAIFNGLGEKVLNVANIIGKFLVNIRDGIRDTNAFGKLIENGGKIILSLFETLIDVIKQFVDFDVDFESIFSSISDFFAKLGTAMVDPNVFYKITDAIKQFFSEVKGVITGELDIKDTGFYFVAGFVEGLKSYVKMAYDKVKEFGKNLLEKLKDVLGIHSPATKVIEIAIYFVKGFLVGLNQMLNAALQAVRDFGIGLINAFKEGLSGTSDGDAENVGENFMYKIAKGLGTGFRVVVGAVKQAINVIKPYVTGFYNWLKEQTNGFDISTILGYYKAFATGKLTLSLSSFFKSLSNLDGIEGLIGKVGGVLDTLKEKIFSFGEETEDHTSGLLVFAEAIGILTLSLYGLANIPDFQSQIVKLGELIAVAVSSYGAILAISKGLGGVDGDSEGGGIFGKLKSFFSLDPQSKEMRQMGTMLIKLAASIFILAGAVKLMSTIPEEDATRSMYYITALIAEVTAVAKYISSANGSLKGAGSAFLGLAVSVLLLVTAVKKFADMSNEDFINGAIKTFAMLMILAKATKSSGKGLGAGTGFGFIGLAVSMLILIQVMKQLADMDWGDLIKGISALLILMVAMIFAGEAIGNTAGGMKTAGLQMLLMSASMLIIAKVVRELGAMSVDELAIGVAGFGAAMFVLCKAMQSLSKVNGKGVLASTASVVLLGIGLVLIAHSFETVAVLPWEAIGKGLLLMAATMLSMNSVVKSSKGISFKEVLKTLATLFTTITAIVLMAAAIGWADTATNGSLSEILTRSIDELKTVRSALIQMTTIMLIFNKATVKSLKGLDYKTVLKTLGTMVTVIAALTLTLSALGGIDYLTNGGLSTILNSSVKELKSVRKAMVEMTAIMLLFMTLFNKMLPITALPLGVMSKSILKAILVIAEVIGGLTVLFSAIGGLVYGADYIGIDIIGAIKICGDLLYAIGEVFGKAIGGFVSGTLSFIPDLGRYLSQFALNVLPFFTMLKSLSESDLNLADILVNIILKMAAAQFLNGINKLLGFAGNSAIDDLAAGMGTIGTAVKTFSDAAEGINEEDATKAANVAQVIANLYTNLPKTGGVIQNIFGEQDLSKFGEGMQNVADGIVKFAIGIAAMKTVSVSDDDITKATNIALTLAELQNNLPETGGKIQSFFGEKSLENFGTGMGYVADGIKAFVTTLDGVTIDENLVTQATNIAQTLAELQNNLPSTGGAIQTFFGEQDLESFGTQMGAVGTGINAFITNLGETSISQDQIDMASNVGTMLADLEGSLTKHDGVLQFWTGDTDFESFGTNIGHLGDGLKTFSDNATLLDTDASEKAVDIAEDLASIESSLKDDTWFTSTNKLDTFAGNINTLSTALLSLDGVSALNLSIVVAQIKSLFNFLTDEADSMSSLAGEEFAYQVTALGDAIASFISQGMTSDESATTLANGVYTMIDNISKAIKNNEHSILAAAVTVFGSTNGFAGGIDKTKMLILTKVKTILNLLAFTMKSYNQTYNSIGESLFRDNFLVGIQSQSGAIYTTSRVIVQTMWQIIANYTGAFYSVGVQLMAGLTNGIYANSSSAINAAAATAAQALRRSKAVLGIHSPSKEFWEIGRYSMLGMSNGLTQNANLATSAAGDVGNETMDTMVEIVQRIQNMLDQSLDYTPTIRPIMDASNIQNGVSAIDSMFGNRYLGTLGNINYVSQMRADRGNIINQSVEVDNNGIIEAINNVGMRIDNLETAMSNMQIQMDGNATVGQIYNKMDKRLGLQAKYKGRGI